MTGVFGTLIGAVAGYFRALDNPLMRLMDALMAFPAILLAITVSAVLGASVPNVIIALSIATTPHTARIVRASVLVVRELEYVEAARALGASEARVLFRHVLLNALGPADRAAHLRVRRRNPRGSRPVLHRCRAAAADAVLRRHHRAGPRLHGGSAVDHPFSGPCDHRLACSASISSATACAMSSIRG